MKRLYKLLTLSVLSVMMFFSSTVLVSAEEITDETSNPVIHLKYDDGRELMTMDIVDNKVKLPAESHLGLEERYNHRFVGWYLNDDPKLLYPYQEISVSSDDTLITAYIENKSDLRFTTILAGVTGVDLKGTDNDFYQKGIKHSEFRDEVTRRFEQVPTGNFDLTIFGVNKDYDIVLEHNTPSGDIKVNSVTYTDNIVVVNLDVIASRVGSLMSTKIKFEEKNEIILQYADGEFIETMPIVDGKVHIPWRSDFKQLKKLENKHFEGLLLNDGTEFVPFNKDLDTKAGDILTVVYEDNYNKMQFDTPRSVTGITAESNGITYEATSDTWFSDSRWWVFEKLPPGSYTFTLRGLDENTLYNTTRDGGAYLINFTVTDEAFVGTDYVVKADIEMKETHKEFLRVKLQANPTVTLQYEDGEFIEKMPIVDGKVFIPYSFKFNQIKKIDNMHFEGLLLNDGTEFVPFNKHLVTKAGDTLTVVYQENYNMMQFEAPRSVTGITAENNGITYEATSNSWSSNSRTWVFDKLSPGSYTFTLRGLDEKALYNTTRNGGAKPINFTVTDEAFVGTDYVVKADIEMKETHKEFLRVKLQAAPSITLQYEDGEFIEAMPIVDGKVFIPWSFKFNQIKKNENMHFEGLLLNDGTEYVPFNKDLDTKDGDTLTVVYEDNYNMMQFDAPRSVTGITAENNGISYEATSNTSFSDSRRWVFDKLPHGNYTFTLRGLDENALYNTTRNGGAELINFTVTDEAFVGTDYVVKADIEMKETHKEFLRVKLKTTPTVTLQYEDGEFIEKMPIVDGKVFIPWSFKFNQIKKIENMHFEGLLLNDGTEYVPFNKDLETKDGDTLTVVYEDNYNMMQFDAPRSVTGITAEHNGITYEATSDTWFSDSRWWVFEKLPPGSYTFTLRGLDEKELYNTTRNGGAKPINFIVTEEAFVGTDYVVKADIEMKETHNEFLRVKLKTTPTVTLQYDDGEFIEKMPIVDGKVFIPWSFKFNQIKKIENMHFEGLLLNDGTAFVPFNKDLETKDGDTLTVVYEDNYNMMQFDAPRSVTGITAENNGITYEATSNTSFSDSRRWVFDKLPHGNYTFTLRGLDEKALYNTTRNGGAKPINFTVTEEAFVGTDYIVKAGIEMKETHKEFLRVKLQAAPSITLQYEDGEFIEAMPIIDGKVSIPLKSDFKQIKTLENKHFAELLLNDETESITFNRELEFNDGDVLTVIYKTNKNKVVLDVPRHITGITFEKDGELFEAISNQYFRDERRWFIENLEGGNYTISIKGVTTPALYNVEKSGGDYDIAVQIEDGSVTDGNYVFKSTFEMPITNQKFVRLQMTETALHQVNFNLGEHGSSTEELNHIVKNNESITEMPTVKEALGYKFIGYSLDGKDIVNPLDIVVTKDLTFVALYTRSTGTFEFTDPTHLITRATLTNHETQQVYELELNADDETSRWSISDLPSGEYTLEFEGLPENALIEVVENTKLRSSHSHTHNVVVVMDANDPNASQTFDFKVAYNVTFELGNDATTSDELNYKVYHNESVTAVPHVVSDRTFKGWSIDNETLVNPLDYPINDKVIFIALYEDEEVIDKLEPTTPTEDNSTSEISDTKVEPQKVETPKTDVRETYLMYIILVIMSLMTLTIGKRYHKKYS